MESQGIWEKNRIVSQEILTCTMPNTRDYFIYCITINFYTSNPYTSSQTTDPCFLVIPGRWKKRLFFLAHSPNSFSAWRWCLIVDSNTLLQQNAIISCKSLTMILLASLTLTSSCTQVVFKRLIYCPHNGYAYFCNRCLIYKGQHTFVSFQLSVL